MKNSESLVLIASLATAASALPVLGSLIVDPVQRLSHIETVVNSNGDGTYTYNYRVVNDSPAPQSLFEEISVWPSIVGYEIPLDDPSVVWNVLSPATWGYRFLSANQYQTEYGEPNPFSSAYVLQWYDLEFGEGAKMIVPTGFNTNFETDHYEPYADGFSITSRLSPVDGPYANLWFDFFRNIGDPPLPGGSIGGGGLPYTVIPEPPLTVFSAVGLLGLGAWVCWRRRNQ
jgi:hypothetical protein